MVGPGELRKGVSGVVKPTMPTCTQRVVRFAKLAVGAPATEKARCVIVFERTGQQTMAPETDLDAGWRGDDGVGFDDAGKQRLLAGVHVAAQDRVRAVDVLTEVGQLRGPLVPVPPGSAAWDDTAPACQEADAQRNRQVLAICAGVRRKAAVRICGVCVDTYAGLSPLVVPDGHGLHAHQLLEGRRLVALVHHVPHCANRTAFGLMSCKCDTAATLVSRHGLSLIDGSHVLCFKVHRHETEGCLCGRQPALAHLCQ